MSSRHLVAVVATLTLAPAAASAQAVGIRNSVHDFSRSSTGRFTSDDTDQLCIFCHTPHKALSTAYLWNRALPAQTFSLYSSASLNADMPTAVKASSLRCLSCHDGTVAIDSFNAGRTWGSPRMAKIGDIYYPGSIAGSGANIGGISGADLTDDHPVSFVYNAALVAKDPDLVDPTAVEAAGLPLAGVVADEKTLECTTCHEVHRQFPNQYLLRVPVDNASQLCLTCHKK